MPRRRVRPVRRAPVQRLPARRCRGGLSAASAAASTSSRRIRPPTPVPVTVARSIAVVGGQLADHRGDVGAHRRWPWPAAASTARPPSGPGLRQLPGQASMPPSLLARRRARGCGAATGSGSDAASGSGSGSGSASGSGAGFASGVRWAPLGAGAASASPMTPRSADLDRLVLGDRDLQQRPGHRRRHLGVHLVGGDLEQRLVDLDRCRRPA